MSQGSKRPKARVRVAAIALFAATAGWTGVAVAQNTGTVRPFTQQERAQGAQAHQQILQEFGDGYTGRQADYVRMVGQNVAVHTGLSSARTDYTITLLNSPVNNAFALPGGYIYVTRQLMALMNSEAELAAVLAHEDVHTAMRHARQRNRRAGRAQGLGMLATILGGAIGDNGGILGTVGGLLQGNAMQAAQLYTLGFSRGQETEADDIGLTYMRAAGYDPMALSSMLASLGAQSQLDQRLSTGGNARSVPEMWSTHPDPASRVQRAAANARQAGAGGRVNRDQFLNAIDGMLYGDDPRQGVVEGQNFLHPDLRLGFTVPQGFGMQNGTNAVSISGQNAQARFSTAAYNGDLDAYVRAAFQSLARGSNGQQPQLPAFDIRRTTVNGIPAATATTRANSGQQQIDVTVFAYEFAPDRAYHFVALTPATAGQAAQTRVFEPMFGSVRRLNASEAAAIRPRLLSVITVRRGDTVQSLADRMAYRDNQLERFLVLNGLTAGATLTPGQRVKIVVYGAQGR